MLKFLPGCVGALGSGEAAPLANPLSFALAFIYKDTANCVVSAQTGGGLQERGSEEPLVSPGPPPRKVHGEGAAAWAEPGGPETPRGFELCCAGPWTCAVSQLCPYIWLWNVPCFNDLLSSRLLPKSRIPSICFKSKQSMTGCFILYIPARMQPGGQLTKLTESC